MELLLIRWIPANVRYIGFFSNFLLIASFLGIGLGILLGRNGASPRLSPFAFVLAGVVALVGHFQLNVQVRSSEEIFFGLAESRAADLNFLILPLVVGLVVALLATLALPLGPLLKSMWPLKAYAIDIIGSMSGIAAFALMSALGTDPVVWFAVAFGLVAAVEIGRTRLRWAFVNSAVLAAVVVLVLLQASPNEIWSPYYRIDSFRDSTGKEHLTVDGIPHQALHEIDDPKEEFYEQVYRWFPERTFGRVLVVGAGSGTDVAIALREGAEHVDAVEIDPAIQQIGIERHPNRPYDDPRVDPFVNDGRAFLRTTAPGTTYDLVIFALPDSLTLVSSQSALRLESFLFTEEAFEAVREHLDPQDGVFVLYNYYRDPWLVHKIAAMLEAEFGHEPLVATYSAHKATLAAGPLIGALEGGPPPADAGSLGGLPAIGPPEPVPATDDWPFLYLRTEFIPPHYLAALAIILIGALLAVAGAARVTGTTLRRFSPHFFVLGVAFLLLTTRSLVSFSLLFGTTWVVNAMAFFAILASVLLAIFVNARWPIRRPTPFYVLLFVSIALAFLLPPESLLIDPPWLRYTLAAAVAFAPVFFANLVFSYSFRDTNSADMAFASNLLGAMVGGAIEYLALITGYGFLLVVVAALYGLAWLFATRLRLLNDVELADREPLVPPPAPAPKPVPPEPSV